jgi:hypothetical protein
VDVDHFCATKHITVAWQLDWGSKAAAKTVAKCFAFQERTSGLSQCDGVSAAGRANWPLQAALEAHGSDAALPLHLRSNPWLNCNLFYTPQHNDTIYNLL